MTPSGEKGDPMKLLKKLLCAGLCLALTAGLAACEKEEEPSSSSSSQPESSAVSPAPSEPEPESSRFVPAPDLIPNSGVEEDDPFELVFSQNPIDKKYDADYSVASSFSLMHRACDDAADAWKRMVKTAFQSALEVTAESDREALRAEQNDWEEELSDRLRAIREDAGDGNEGILTAARETVLVYRDRVKALCRIKFEGDGSLPDFPDPDGEVSAVG